MSQATWAQRAYMAGFLDGDGCIRLSTDRGTYHRPSVTIGNTNPDSFTLFLRLYGGSLYCTTEVGNRKPCLIWNCLVNRQQEFLNDIFPFLRIKRRQALLLLTYFRHRRPGSKLSPVEWERQRYIHYQLKELNRRGRPLLQSGPEIVPSLVFNGREPTRAERSWMAGIIDSEGCIGLTKYRSNSRQYAPAIHVCNSDPNGVKLFQELYPGSCNKKKGKDAWKVTWDWYCSPLSQERLLWDVLPFLVIKKCQAQLLIVYHYYKVPINRYPEEILRRETIYQELKRLNKKGI